MSLQLDLLQVAVVQKRLKTLTFVSWTEIIHPKFSSILAAATAQILTTETISDSKLTLTPNYLKMRVAPWEILWVITMSEHNLEIQLEQWAETLWELIAGKLSALNLGEIRVSKWERRKNWLKIKDKIGKITKWEDAVVDQMIQIRNVIFSEIMRKKIENQ